eukprot:5961774-Alexandrium_andersonii.AAC.1
MTPAEARGPGAHPRRGAAPRRLVRMATQAGAARARPRGAMGRRPGLAPGGSGPCLGQTPSP